ncbi:MAG: hypothetical protein ACI39F_04065 [Acutalibacteraceae bacterium]
MKNSKRMLCLVMAVLVMFGSMGLMSAFAETGTSGSTGTTTVSTATTQKQLTGEAKNLLTFTDDMLKQAKWLTCDEMTKLYGEELEKATEYVYNKDGKTATTAGSSVKANSDNSITLSKTGDQFGANLEIPVTDEMRENYSKAENSTFYMSYYLTKAAVPSGTFVGEFTNCQLRIYTKFKTPYTETKESQSYSRYIKLTTLGKNNYQCYQQSINKAVKFVDENDKPLENLDNVESIIISLYNFSAVDASMEISSIAYDGVPKIKAFEEPAPAGDGEVVSMTDWSKHYLKADYANTPGTIKYSAEGGYDANTYKSIGNKAGWVYFKNMNAASNKQINLFFNLDRDAFNKAIVTANQPGGSKKLTVKGKFPVIKDTEGKSMVAELEIQYYTYDGKSVTPVKTFVEPNKEFEFEIDTSELTVNSVESLKMALMAFWYYDASEDVFYDTDKARKYDKDNNLLTAKYDEETKDFLGYDDGTGGALKTEDDVVKILADCSDGRKDVDVTSKVKNKQLTTRTMKDIEGFISPFTAGGSLTVTTKATSKTTAGNGDYEYAGYHFYDFTPQAYAETYGWGTHASFVNYLSADYYDSYEIVDKDYDKDDMKQGYKDRNNPSVKVNGDSTYKQQFNDAKSLVSGGYEVEMKSPYPRVQLQNQAYYHVSGADEDARLLQNGGDHKNQTAQGEKYDFTEQMRNGLKYAKENPDPQKKGFLAIDVYVLSSVHGYKNIYNSTYKAWCQKNGKTVQNENSGVEVMAAIHGNVGTEDVSVSSATFVQPGEKKTIYLDVSELEVENITAVRIVGQNYANMANKEQGGNNNTCGITDVQVRYSAIYVPGNKNTDLTTTVNVTRPFSLSDAKKIKKLYDALPGLSVDDYNTDADYKKLAAFIKAWTKASEATQKYCEEKYGIDYAKISMLEADVYEKLYGSGANGADGGDGGSPLTGDIAFPMVSLLVAGLAGYAIIKTRKKKK